MNFEQAFDYVALRGFALTKEEKKNLLNTPGIYNQLTEYYNINVKNTTEEFETLFNWFIGAVFNTCVNEITNVSKANS